MNGFRQQPQGSKKEKLRALETELQNATMANRISQLMIKQMLQNSQAMQEDLSKALNLITDLQYRTLALQKVTNVDMTQLASVADELRLKDFNEASAKENAEKNYAVGTTVNDESVVVITSTTDVADQGIFRSKLKLADCGVPDLIKAFNGREVGAKAVVKLNGIDHTVELLEVLQPPAVAETAPAAETAAQA